MIECAKAQEIISVAYDGEHGDSSALELAKQHCRTCTECAAFVRTLASIHRVAPPEMPAASLERVLEGVRAEYGTAPTEQQAAEEVTAEKTAAAQPHPVAVSGPDAPVRPSPPLRRPMPAWAPWAAAAAVLLVFASIATTQGVRYLLEPSRDQAMLGGEVSVTDSSREAGQDGAASEAAPSLPQEDAATSAQGPAYVVFGQEVYTLLGPADRPTSGTPVGSLTSALDSGAAAQTYSVYAGTEPGTIVVVVDDGALTFSAVTRPLRGRPFALRSGSISTFGQWPSLPSGIPEPASPDGSPVFIEAGTDDLGVPIFVRPGTDPSSGFAIAPGTAASDPAAGNTGWTWWEPQR